MDTHPYHNYLFFDLTPEFYQQPAGEQTKVKAEFAKILDTEKTIIITPYLTRGYKPDTIFMLWCRSQDPCQIQTLVSQLQRSQTWALAQVNPYLLWHRSRVAI